MRTGELINGRGLPFPRGLEAIRHSGFAVIGGLRSVAGPSTTVSQSARAIGSCSGVYPIRGVLTGLGALVSSIGPLVASRGFLVVGYGPLIAVRGGAVPVVADRVDVGGIPPFSATIVSLVHPGHIPLSRRRPALLSLAAVECGGRATTPNQPASACTVESVAQQRMSAAPWRERKC